MEFDPLYIITIISVSIAAVVGVFTIRNEIKKGRDEANMRIASQIKNEGSSVRQFIDERFGVVDSKFQVVDNRITSDEKDIADIEVDMKQMIHDFKEMCEKLSKHDYIIEGLVPDFKQLQDKFYGFKGKVDKTVYSQDTDIVQNNDSQDMDNGGK